MRTIIFIGVLIFGPSAMAKAPAGQGKACDARSACGSGLQCVPHRDGRSTCEIVCAASTKCPEDQRCVKDGPQTVCRPITDLIGP
jgi:hypothetical protein